MSQVTHHLWDRTMLQILFLASRQDRLSKVKSKKKKWKPHAALTLHSSIFFSYAGRRASRFLTTFCRGSSSYSNRKEVQFSSDNIKVQAWPSVYKQRNEFTKKKNRFDFFCKCTKLLIWLTLVFFTFVNHSEEELKLCVFIVHINAQTISSIYLLNLEDLRPCDVTHQGLPSLFKLLKLGEIFVLLLAFHGVTLQVRKALLRTQNRKQTTLIWLRAIRIFTLSGGVLVFWYDTIALQRLPVCLNNTFWSTKNGCVCGEETWHRTKLGWVSRQN